MQLEQSHFKENAGGINSCIVDGCLPVENDAHSSDVCFFLACIGRTVAFLDAQ